MSLKNIGIPRKLAMGFAAVILVSVAVSGMLWKELGTIQGVTAEANTDNATIIMVDRVTSSIEQERSAVRAYVAAPQPNFFKDMEDGRQRFHSTIEEAARLFPDDHDGEKLRLEKIRQVTTDWENKIVDQEMRDAGDVASHAKAVEVVANGISGKVLAPAFETAKEMQKVEQAQIDESLDEQNSAEQEAMLVLISGSLGILAIAVIVGWLLARSIATPIVQMTRSMRRLAEGDNDIDIPASDRGDEIGSMAKALLIFKESAIEKKLLEAGAAEQQRLAAETESRDREERALRAEEQREVVSSVAFGLEKLSGGELTFRLSDEFAADYEKLRTDFNGAMAQLQQTMQVVIENTEGIRSSADEISNAADNLSHRTEQQAASLEETAAALDQITATVRKTAEGATLASDVVNKAKHEAEESDTIVGRAVSAMSAIEKSSKEISQIIGVIDEIAFQTNLLALNAGVEAARAGDAGRGFAVVATEVRALAQRSADAAKEIKGLISNSGRQVASGVELVGATGQALQRIVGHVSEIKTVVGEIAASAQEQATGLGQVNTAVNQMDQMTQQNAAMVEESTAASRALSTDAESLADLMRGFHVEDRPVVVQRQAPSPKPRSSKPSLVFDEQDNRAKPARAPRRAANNTPAPAPRQKAVQNGGGWEEF